MNSLRGLVCLRVFSATALAVGLSVLTTGAASARTVGASKSGSTITLQFLANPAQQPGYNILIPNFERVYPNIVVNATYTPVANIQSTTSTQIAAGNGPDLAYGSGGTGGINAALLFGPQGVWAALDGSPWIKKSVPKWMVGTISDGKHYYSWQNVVSLASVIYNTDAFKQYGLQVPTTFSQMLTLCQKITALGKIPFGFGASEYADNVNLAQNLAANYVFGPDPSWTRSRLANKTTFVSDPRWQMVFTKLQDMKNANCFAPQPAGTTRVGTVAQIAQGQALMYPSGSFQLPSVQAAAVGIKLGLFPFPGDTAEGTYSAIGETGIVINAKSAHLAAAKTFVNFLARPKQAALMANLSGGVDPFSMKKGILPPTYSLFVPLSKANHFSIAAQTFFPTPGTLVAWGTAMEGLWTGQTTANDVLKAMDDSWGK